MGVGFLTTLSRGAGEGDGEGDARRGCRQDLEAAPPAATTEDLKACGAHRINAAKSKRSFRFCRNRSINERRMGLPTICIIRMAVLLNTATALRLLLFAGLASGAGSKFRLCAVLCMVRTKVKSLFTASPICPRLGDFPERFSDAS